MTTNKRKKFVILEIGAGPAQPLAREMANMRYLNDKYKCTLIRINPMKERLEHYKWEKEQYEKINLANGMKMMRMDKVDKMVDDVEYQKSTIDTKGQTQVDRLVDRHDQNEGHIMKHSDK